MRQRDRPAAEAAADYQRRVDSRRRIIVGMNDFVKKFSINVESNLKDIINCLHNYRKLKHTSNMNKNE